MTTSDKKTLIIDGGLGRHVCAIPALEKFVELNPNSKIVTNFWTSIFWGNRKLQNHIFDASFKDIYQEIKDSDIRKIEPYYNRNFLNEKINLVQAFDEEINNTSENLKPKIYLSKKELYDAKKVLGTNKKIIAYQPFGSTSTFELDSIIDESVRSLNLKTAICLLELFLSNGYKVLLYDNRGYPFFDRQGVINVMNLDHRTASAFIAESDYFVGIDSSGQHIAHAFDKPGTTFFGGTSKINFGYPDWFTVITRENYKDKHYAPIRISEFDFWIANLANQDLLDFTEEENLELCELILTDIKNKIGPAEKTQAFVEERKTCVHSGDIIKSGGNLK